MTADLKKDPAIERWAAMRDHTHFYYRFNFKKIIPTAIMLGLIPAGIVYYSLVSFDCNEKLRNTERSKMLWRSTEAEKQTK